MRTTSPTALDMIPDGVREFFAKRFAEVLGVLMLALCGGMGLALVSWSAQDPSWNHATKGPVRNLLGTPGAIASDLVMQIAGLAAGDAASPAPHQAPRVAVDHRQYLRRSRSFHFPHK